MFSFTKKVVSGIKGRDVNISANGGSVIDINGKVYSGNSVYISGDKVIVDGVVQGEENLVGPINIIVHGDIDSLEVIAGDIIVNGDVGYVNATSGDIEVIGGVGGGINTTSGDIRCGGNIGGNVSTVSGDIIGGRKR